MISLPILIIDFEQILEKNGTIFLKEQV